VLATCSFPSDLHEGPPQASFFQASSAAVTLVGAGDIAGCTSSYHDEQTATLVQDVISSSPNVTVVVLGDNVYQGFVGDYPNCYGPSWGKFKSRTRPAVGNHEYESGTANPHFDYFNGVGSVNGPAGKRGEGWYSYDVGKWHIVVLNVNSTFVGTRTGSPQMTWLKNDLAATAQPCILAYWHHPRYYSVKSGSIPAPDGYHLDFWKELYATGTDLILNGHSHIYERFAPQTPTGVVDLERGVRQITAGTGGSTGAVMNVIHPNSEVVNGITFGVIKLTLDDGRYAWEFLPESGKTFTDKGVGICHGSPEPAGNAAPVASFRHSCDGLDCSFTDSSSDPDGAVVEWGWSFGNGTTSVRQHPTRSFATSGTYTVRLTVRDTEGVMRSSSQQVAVGTQGSGPANTPPVAAFTATCSGLTCAFQDGSTDPDGSVTTWEWDFGEGGSSTLQNPTRTYAGPGTFTVTLTVGDDDGATVGSSKPVTVTGVVSPIALSVTGRQDATRQYMTLDWTGAKGTTVNVYRNGPFLESTANDGHYTNSRTAQSVVTYVYKVCEAGTTVCSNEASVSFGGGTPPPNESPTASFASSCTDLSCVFTDASSDLDGTVTAWRWTFGDGGSSTERSPHHTYAVGGTYTVTLVATDDDEATGTLAKPISVTPAAPNQAPTASFTASCTGLSCAFTDTSTDPDGSVTTWEWDFGDGSTASTRHPTYSFATEGTYNVTLIATDDDGATGTADRSVTATPPPPNQAPTASFTASCTGLSCAFTDTSTDPDGSLASWEWDFGDGSTASTRHPTHSFAAEGTYNVTLIATDDDGATGTAHRSVTATPPPPNQAPVADFTVSCTDLVCGFTDTSTDPDGTVASWGWDFGDGSTSTARSPSRTYAAGGTYPVLLTVTDNDGATSQRSASVTVTQLSAILLTVTGRQDATKQYMTLDWTGARGTTVDTYRNGAFLANTANDGHYTNSRTNKGAITYVYKVCEAGTTVCSNNAAVSFP
jgi:PKD repeat protein